MRHILVFLVAAAVVALLARVADRKMPTKGKGIRHLGWPLGLRIGVAIGGAFSLAVVWMAAQAKPDQATMATIVSSLFVAGAVYLAYCVFLYRVWWTQEGIGSWHPLGGGRFLRWDDVESGGYVGSLQAFHVTGAGTRVWYSPMQSGLGALHRYIAMRLHPMMPEGPDEPETSGA